MGADSLVVVEENPQEEPKNEVEKAIKSRKTTYNGIYSDIGTALDRFSTEELADYYIKNILGGESSLRYYLEQQIIASEIKAFQVAIKAEDRKQIERSVYNSSAILKKSNRVKSFLMRLRLKTYRLTLQPISSGFQQDRRSEMAL